MQDRADDDDEGGEEQEEQFGAGGGISFLAEVLAAACPSMDLTHLGTDPRKLPPPGWMDARAVQRLLDPIHPLSLEEERSIWCAETSAAVPGASQMHANLQYLAEQ